ncbi:ubiquitin specific peptidase echinus isoform X2 [Rhodnius prolixus]|uniref:ubiquitin specific peptidase echinus isoform X2 n=1 Tax=Rhodnius prolixus TaxID=13249 RepID=UPI003D18CBE0
MIKMKDRVRTKKALFQISKVLWHLDIFRRSFRELSGHTCMLDSCIFCALKELFSQLQFSHESALPPDALRRALAESFFDQQRFQLGYMDDAAECFENILLRIHFHLASSEAEDLCSARHCIPHVKFAMTLVEQSVCGACGATSEPLPFTQMVHYVSASALISQAKQVASPTHPDLFGQLLKKAGGMGDIRDCPSACGAKIQIRRTLTNHPEIVSVGIVWDSDRPSLEHIMSLLMTLRTTLRLSDVFHTPSPVPTASNSMHQLVGVVTYYGKHYSTFFFHTKLKVWIYFDDANVREVGSKWEQVVEKCRRGRYQPLLLLFAAPDGTPVDPSTAPSTTTIAPRAMAIAAARSAPAGQVPTLGRRSLTPSPEKPSLATLSQRRAVTPNPEQSNENSAQRVLSEYQNLSQMQKMIVNRNQWAQQNGNNGVSNGGGSTELVRRDSGNWSGDRNSASSSSSTSLENPYQYIISKMHNRVQIVPRSPTSLKGGESSSSGSQCDPGYDSYSLSSTDSLPLQQTLKHNLQLAQIPEGHQSPASLGNMHCSNRIGPSECERLCEEADMLLKHSQATDDLEKALSYANAAVGKARQAMDAPYSNPQAASAARMKHNTCIMQARSIHKRLEDPNGPRHGEGRHSREGSGCSARGSTGSHSRQNSRDKGNHSRQNSKEMLINPVPETKSKEIPEKSSEKSIEIYATLPKTRKGLLSRATKTKNTVEDEEYLLYDRPGRSLNRNNKSPNGKKEEKRARSEDRSVKTQKEQKEKEFVSNQISKDAKKQVKAEEQKQGKKQHKIRRKLLMGGLIRRKNRSMPDLREDEVTVKGVSKDDSNLGKIDKPGGLSGYLSEGHLEYSGNPNLEKSKLMRKSFHNSKILHLAKVPPPPPLRTTSQLSKSDRSGLFPLSENFHQNWQEQPQSLPPMHNYTEKSAEVVTYANGGYLLNSNAHLENNYQTTLVTTAQVHQVGSPPISDFNKADLEEDFILPPYPSPLNSVTHSRQASEEFPPPPVDIQSLTPSTLLEQLQQKRQQILNENGFKESSSFDTVDSTNHKQSGGESWLRELQAKQAAIKSKDNIESLHAPITHTIEKQSPLPNQETNFRNHTGFNKADGRKLEMEKPEEQVSSVKDLKSRFENISVKPVEKPSTKTVEVSTAEKIKSSSPSTLSNGTSSLPSVENKVEQETKSEEIKSNLVSSAKLEELKRKPSKKKNVTFCEQVVLVATAEEDKVNSYIPNPILERVLRSVLHRDSPHQETKEIAVHSVVPLKRNDSGSYGQCSARNQPEAKENGQEDRIITDSDKNDKTVDNVARVNGFQRMLPSPVPSRQITRTQAPNQLTHLHQNMYKPQNGLPITSQASLVHNGLPEQQINSGSDSQYEMHSLQYYPEDPVSHSNCNGSLQRDSYITKQMPDIDMTKYNLLTSSGLKSDFNSLCQTDLEQKNVVMDHMISGIPTVENVVYEPSAIASQNSNPGNSQLLMQNGQIHNLHPVQHQIVYNQNYSSQSASSLALPPLNVLQSKSHPVNMAVSQTTSPLSPNAMQSPYQHVPFSTSNQYGTNVQQNILHGQLTQPNQQIQNLRQQPLTNSQQTVNSLSQLHQPQRNIPSPNVHNQMLQNQLRQPINNHNSCLNGQNMQQHYQINQNHQLSNGYQQKNNSAIQTALMDQQLNSAYSSIAHNQVPTSCSQSRPYHQVPLSYTSHQQHMLPANIHQQAQINHNNHVNGTPAQNISSNAGLPSQTGQLCQGSSSGAPSPSLPLKSQSLQFSVHQTQQPSLQQPCYMPLPQKVRPHLSNGLTLQNKSRPATLYQHEAPIQEYNQQQLQQQLQIKKDVQQRSEVYQRVPNPLLNEQYALQNQFAGNSINCTYQTTQVPNNQLTNCNQQQNSQATQQPGMKYSPYQHPPPPRQMDPAKVQSTVRSTVCNLCKKKQIVPPAVYCTDCDFYMSRFKPRNNF